MDIHPTLYVEGRDDQWTILSLLSANGITLKKDEGPVSIQQTESVDTMLDGLATFIKSFQAKRMAVGFVLDIDLDLDKRWGVIKAKLKTIGYEINDDSLTKDGVILHLKNGVVGFWLMPDNLSKTGKLEDFLRTMIPQDDQILPIANKYLEYVRSLVLEANRFRDVDFEKAELSSWLAVRNPPGLPYGTAIKAQILLPTSPTAKRFVSWFCELYGIADSFRKQSC